MSVQQLSVFVENKAGRLAEITDVLAKSNVDIRAISVADTSDFGILRIIVNKPMVAVDALRESGMTVSLTDVVAIGINDVTGEFAKVVRNLSDEGLTIEYIYAFMSEQRGRAFIIIRVDNNEKAIKVLKEKGVKILTSEDIEKI